LLTCSFAVGTIKELIISDKKRRILYVSGVYKGREHDYSLLQKEFPPDVAWFEGLRVRLDLGFQGFQDLYACAQLHIPVKRKRTKKGISNELSLDQKQHNQESSKERIVVEHAIGGMKRYRILEHRNRLRAKPVINQVVGVCAGLWNFSLTN
jgi:DDE superfamily endonuclease